ncbi:MAG: dihydropteroate synthase [Deltaproteobacteria bacterium HGW-Deltaproteobacteria-7]|nr:MAG: dihydropteroate synthase [Deltaproteobacteria bacterium HGW-Deltaproteobacteria-7]PKN20655.1 MAG: dihydropteroate synthase [Deltaproteobacteria bacterium HGW-Deltaproteobacteria-6]
MKIVKINNSNEAVEIFRKIGVDPYGISAMAPKTQHVNILLKAQSCKVANILKQEMLALNGDAAVARGSVACSIDTTDVLLMGTLKQVSALSKKIEKQPFGLDAIAKDILNLLGNIEQDRYILKTSRRKIVLGEKTLIMGILNITPDSFSDGNIYLDPQKAIGRALQMADEGADIIDIGGESTRPGSKSVTLRQEITRVVPIIEFLSRKLKIPISVDTTKSQVAQKALEAGAEIINDISSLGDNKMASVIRKASAALILMHMRGTPANMQTGNLVYEDLMHEINCFLEDRCRKAVAAGIGRNQLVVDPGIGFGKTYEDNCRIIKSLSELKILGLPLLIGPSRKAFIGKITGGAPAERTDGTAAAVSAAIMNGCNIVRVHDVAVIKKVAAMTDAIVQA